ncbi:replication-associated protein [Avon-Heathcote Estuary associated circular virus 17]|uniref:replication-associated protein n=1 Tax=Avon-Heathcote Estuary associated circular virus 17 TaxID=1618240 RepID=UPI0005CDB399|nr:replication-associated protein [Avon-Heathcote Estuary associated circular virus 17]AJP36439.1 replication-associated protein [Avon-Heathcote Estuary associated circular virus 18]AJP36442.1 replication-associated protein [Avon-Heathcote Estuary associated circular virus 17]
MPETIRNAVLTNFNDPMIWEDLSPKLRYFAYGEEICPETKREHFQCFAQAWKPMRLTGWKKLFPTAHIEIMRGNFRENEAYCSKEGKLTEYGEKPNENGKKSTLINYKRKIDEGDSVLGIAEMEDYFPTYVMYRNGLHEYKRHVRSKKVQNDRTMPEVYVRIGPAGTGKTRWMDEKFGLDGWIQAPDNTGKWFDGCDRDVILFDDVEAGQIPPLSSWKRLCDRYPLQVPIKGGFITWKPKTIVFTSNTHPKLWWPNLSEFDVGAIERRITEIVVVE